jgi:hypothetical protein
MVVVIFAAPAGYLRERRGRLAESLKPNQGKTDRRWCQPAYNEQQPREFVSWL